MNLLMFVACSCVSGTRLGTLDTQSHLIFPKSYEVGTIITPILELGKTGAQNRFCHEPCWNRTRISSLVLNVPSLFQRYIYLHINNFIGICLPT